MKKEFYVQYGFVSTTIGNQLDEQGIQYKKEFINRAEKVQNSIQTIGGFGLVSRREMDKLYKKLHKEVVKSINIYNREC